MTTRRTPCLYKLQSVRGSLVQLAGPRIGEPELAATQQQAHNGCSMLSGAHDSSRALFCGVSSSLPAEASSASAHPATHPRQPFAHALSIDPPRQNADLSWSRCRSWSTTRPAIPSSATTRPSSPCASRRTSL
eukprot:2154010-Rhodomonas_salina.7